MKDAINIVDITGNWRETENFLPFIQTREPWITNNKPKVFFQELKLPAGRFTIRFEYEPILDMSAGLALNNDYEHFGGFAVNGKIEYLGFTKDNEDANVFHACSELEFTKEISTVKLELAIYNTRPMRTLLIVNALPNQSKRFKAVCPHEHGLYMLIRGIPFLIRKFINRYYQPDFGSLERGIDRGSIEEWDNGIKLDCGGVKVRKAYFLGMTHNIDIGSGSWYCRKGDNGYSHFAGDRAGEIMIEEIDGSRSPVPLIFGFNLWYGRPWDITWHMDPYTCSTPVNNDSDLFYGKDGYRDLLQNEVMLTDGVRMMGSDSCNARYIFSLDFCGKAVKSIEIKGENSLYDYPLISGITLETESDSDVLCGLPEISSEKISVKAIDLEYISKNKYLPGIKKIQDLFFTPSEDMPDLKTPEIPEGYFGPGYDLRGTREAVYAAAYLYYNGPECGAHIADTGTSCSSSTAKWALHHYTFGTGIWVGYTPLYDGLKEWFRLYAVKKPGELPGCGNAWTRGAGELIREAIAFGYDKFIDKYISWLDNALLTEAYPPHWNRVAGAPDFMTQRIMIGKTEERGNRENDGHGICMWGRYMVWHWSGRSKEWNEKHWKATKAAADWIGWQLDKDHIYPGARKDVLFTESECAHGSYDIYSSYNCLHGLKLSVRMAEQLGMKEAAEWKRVYNRLRQGILDELTDESGYGPIWHTYPETEWQDHAHKLVHIQLASDGDTYTPLQDQSDDDISGRYLEISKNTYRYLMKDKNYNCLRMYGYGQGMMAQSALLLDEMEDAKNFIYMLLNHCYLPQFGRWTGPEGIILHKSGRYYLPVNGYMGQDSHVADSTKAVRLMLGIDDNDPLHLRIIPRYPDDWTSMAITDYPVCTGSRRQHISYDYERLIDRQSFTFGFEDPVESLSVRLGPMPSGKTVAAAYFNNIEIPFEPLASGDSSWIWVRGLFGRSGNCEIKYR